MTFYQKTTISLFIILFSIQMHAQEAYWQQRADYKIAIDFDAEKDLFRGTQTISYHNQSPDTLHRLYFHLYYNAFQPNSMMDHWQQNVPDPLYGLDYKIKYLTSSETGYLVVNNVLINSKQCNLNMEETLMEVELNEPILPGKITDIQMSFMGRVPLICRRTGRDNDEGIDYTMSQWYPKLAVYDKNGWDTSPFLGREFYSDFGDYDVMIKLDSNYVVAAGADKITSDSIPGSFKQKWHFISKNVLDFAWAADTEYTHFDTTTAEGITLHFYHLKDNELAANWAKMPEPLSWVLDYINKNYGRYPYKSYSIIQAGDSATEYAKSTFITGNRNPGSLVGVCIHEMMHSWFQQKVATNETRYAWMDEGFSSYASTLIKQKMREEGIFFKNPNEYLFQDQYKEYVLIAKSGLEEAMNTPSNHFSTNTAYYLASYGKGELFLDQLNYLVGQDAFEKGIKRYVSTWGFKHPEPVDFIRIMEQESKLNLDWFLHYWINTTEKIDYFVRFDSLNANQSIIRIQRLGKIPMPLTLEIEYDDGSSARFIIPLNLMQGHKPLQTEQNEVLLESWAWPIRSYNIQLNLPASEIRSIQLDPDLRLADINRDNNGFEIEP